MELAPRLVQSVFGRRSESSTALMMRRLEAPRPLGSLPSGNPTFVASTTSSRTSSALPGRLVRSPRDGVVATSDRDCAAKGSGRRGGRASWWRQSAATMMVSPTQLSVLRMIPIAKKVARAGNGQLAVFRLLNSRRGWDAHHTPVRDAEWALEQVAERLGASMPVCLIGHSLGGRAALLAAGHKQVRSAVALAPWVLATDNPRGLDDQRLLIIHGSDDRIASPQRSAALAQELRDRGVHVATSLCPAASTRCCDTTTNSATKPLALSPGTSWRATDRSIMLDALVIAAVRTG